MSILTVVTTTTVIIMDTHGRDRWFCPLKIGLYQQYRDADSSKCRDWQTHFKVDFTVVIRVTAGHRGRDTF